MFVFDLNDHEITHAVNATTSEVQDRGDDASDSINEFASEIEVDMEDEELHNYDFEVMHWFPSEEEALAEAVAINNLLNITTQTADLGEISVESRGEGIFVFS